MRIAMISTPFVAVPPQGYGGTERVVYELVEGLVANGHDVTLFATGDSRTSAQLAYTLAEARWPPDTMIDVHHVAWAMAKAARGDFDLIHAHSYVALALKRMLPRTPLVYTLHHERNERLSDFYRLNHDAHFVAISHDQAGREIMLPSVSVIHHGLNPADFQCSRTPGDYVCFIGRLSRVKGPHIAIDVAGEAGVPICVAGDIHDADGPEGRLDVLPRLGRPYVRHLGEIGMAAKASLLRNARAMLAPIEWNEPFGLVFIESMLSGCPVVAFGRGSVPELVENGVTGFIVRSAAEMRDVIRPGGVLEHFDRERCRARAVERFSRGRMVQEHERFYERIVGEPWRSSSRDAQRTQTLNRRASSSAW
jgi:glycosyltransferase involved in cell wall biosynthesis